LPISEADSRLEILENTVEEIQASIDSLREDMDLFREDLDTSIQEINRANEMVGSDAEFGRGDQTAREDSLNAWAKAFTGTTQNFQSISGAMAKVLETLSTNDTDLDNEMRNFYARIIAIEDYLDGKFADYEPPRRS
jgi:outer membrane murein-binding lipoprotein Lpp